MGPLHRAGFRVVGLSRRLASSCPCVNGTSGSSCPACAQRGLASALLAACWRVRIGDAFRSRPARTSQAPSLGFLKDLLSVDIPAGVHSHGLAPASARRLPAPRTFRPRRSSRPRRFPPPTGSRACCVPHPTLRFTGFPRTGDACLRPPPRFPTDARPPERFPSEKRSSRRREALPPCRSSATPTRLRGLVPLGNP